MAKKKSRRIRREGSRRNSFTSGGNLRQDRYLLSKWLHSDCKTCQLTRDTLSIANPDNRLSLAAEDLRNKEPFKTNSQHRVFKNVDGSPANTNYKDVPVKKKEIICMVGEVSIVLLILVGLWCVAEDMRDGKCSLPTELLDIVVEAVRNLFGVPNGLNNHI